MAAPIGFSEFAEPSAKSIERNSHLTSAERLIPGDNAHLRRPPEIEIRHFQDLLWLDPGDRWCPIHGPVERRHLAYSGSLGRRNEVGLGVVDGVRF